MRFNINRYYLLFFLFFFETAFSQIPYFEKINIRSNMLQVADSYALAGDLGNAILQYYEYLYRFPEDSIIPVVYYKIAAVYEKSNKLDFAQSYLQKVVDSYSDTKYDLESRMKLSIFLFEKGDYNSSLYSALRQPEFPFKMVSAYNFIALNEI